MSKRGNSLKSKSCQLVVGVLAGYSFLLAPQLVLADEPPAHDANAIYSQTGASKDQLDKIHGIGMDFETKARTNYTTLMGAAQEMQRLSLDPTLDDDKLLATQDQINKLTSEMSNDRIKQLIACRKVLTQEQRVKLVEILKKRREANAAQLGRQQ